MLFTLRSNFYGYIDSFETFEEEMVGTRSFELPTSFTFIQGDTLWLEIKDGGGLPVTLQLTSIDIDEYSKVVANLNVITILILETQASQ